MADKLAKFKTIKWTIKCNFGRMTDAQVGQLTVRLTGAAVKTGQIDCPCKKTGNR